MADTNMSDKTCTADKGAADKSAADKVKGICKNYAASKNLVARYKPKIVYYRECIRDAVTPDEKFIFQREINKLADLIGPAAEIVAAYETAASHVSGRPRLVMKQVYEDGLRWRDVVDESGISLSNGSVSAALKKAHAVMETEITAAESDRVQQVLLMQQESPEEKEASAQQSLCTERDDSSLKRGRNTRCSKSWSGLEHI